jgi:hypothetical protein
LSHSFIPFSAGYFGNGGLAFFVQAGLDIEPPVLSFSLYLGGQACTTMLSFFFH